MELLKMEGGVAGRKQNLPDRRVALVTCRMLGDLIEEDRALVGAFAALGIEAAPVIWDDPVVCWDDWPSVLVRSPWDYVAKAGAMNAWLDELDRVGAEVWNPTSVIRWTLDKHYLKALRDLGVPMPRTEWIEPAGAADLREISSRRGWNGRVVVKPCIGAGARGAFVAGPSVTREDQARFERLRESGSVLVQEFVPEVQASGEISLIFLAGEFSHAVLKRPKAGDWRVQVEYGGSVEAIVPPREALAAARSLLEHAPGPLLYARVDGVLARAGFLLMELELFEPQLYFAHQPAAASRLASAFVGALRWLR